MKTFKQILRCTAVAFALMAATTACTTGEVTAPDPYNQPLVFDISYSTGEAVWSVDSPEALILNKLGVGMTGTVPYLKVKSNTFWTISVPDDCTWMRVSLSADASFAESKKIVGGPTNEVVSTDEKITNVYIKLFENRGDTQETSLEFRFANTQNIEKSYLVPIIQKGALSDGEGSLLTFLKDGFGAGNADDTRIKFYPFTYEVRGEEGAEFKKTYEGVAAAGDPTGRPFSYAGSDKAYVSRQDPSQEYNLLTLVNDIPASGGANIFLDGKGYFDVCVFNAQGKSQFQMLFGAKNCDGRFNAKDLKVWVSKDGRSWDIDKNGDYDGSIHYNRATPVSVNGWAVNKAQFAVVPGVSNILYFRFENTSDDAYRIDDLLFEEYEGDVDQIFSLIQTGSDVIGLPVSYDFTNLKADGTSVKGNYWLSNATILCQESGAYDEAVDEDSVVPTVPESTITSSHVQFITGDDTSIVKTRNDITDANGINNCGITIVANAPRAYGMMEKDFWIWTIPVHNMAASTNVLTNISYKQTAAGPKYMIFQWAQCTKEEYKFDGANIFIFTEQEKREFYESLDWKSHDLVTISVPGYDDYGQTDNPAPAGAAGIPMGSASSPGGYWSGKITYSRGYFSTGSDTTNELSCNFPEAMEDGYLFFRLVCAANLTAGATNSTQFQRINKATNQGTAYLTKAARFSFDGCGTKPAYSNAFRILTSFNDCMKNDNRVDLAPKYVDNGGAVAGIYAGSSMNITASTVGNNVLSGSCENDETGSNVVLYSPYNAMSSTDSRQVILGVPTVQRFDEGYLVANSVPVVSSASVPFKTTNTMRIATSVKSAVLELELYVSKLLSSNVSKIEISTVNPDDETAVATPIAGTYYYDLDADKRGESIALSNTIVSNAINALKVPDTERNPLKVYLGLWEGTHKLWAKIYAGAVYYLVPLEVAEFTENNVTTLKVCVDAYPTYAASDVLTGINSAEQFYQFCTDVVDGKTGKALDQYRNIDGELGFGGAVRDEDKVIDMAGYDMKAWPMCDLPESFNGGNYRIKNLHIELTPEYPQGALFKTIAYGSTISNITFDESCQMTIDRTGESVSTAYYGGMLLVGNTSKPTGNIYNINNYGELEFFGENFYSDYIGGIAGYLMGAPSDSDDAATVISCRNYGRIHFSSYGKSYGASEAAGGYSQIGGICGLAGGCLFEDCYNYGDVVMENVNFHTGGMFLGGILGYNTNRAQANTSTMFGIVSNCHNYGKMTMGAPGNPAKIYVTNFNGIIGRMQWAHIRDCSNSGNITVYAEQQEAYPYRTGANFSNKVKYNDWAAALKSATNALGYVTVSGIFGFTQNNVATGTSFNDLVNRGNIYVECSVYNENYYADNAGVCVGGICGRTGANAYNPTFDGCTNMGNVTLKSNRATADAFVGGICGFFNSNRYTAAYHPYCHSCSNSGKVTFLTDVPSEVIAHAGGVIGAMNYGDISSCVNVGEVVNQSTNEASHTGSIVGTQHRSSITASCAMVPAFYLEGNAVGGSINGNVITKDNYSEYVYGGYESYTPSLVTDVKGKDTNYYFAD